MALAGTLGVGNIVGVASALYVGGPGSIFWMAFSGLVVSVLKYAEILLAVRHQRTGPGGTLSGGAHVYIFDSLARRGHPGAGRFLAAAFGVLCLVNALTMGSVLQINAAAGAMAEGGGGFSIPPLVTGGAMALLCAAVMAGGSRRIAAMTEKLVPFMTLGYLGLCVAVLILRRERLSGAIGDIFRCAFAFAYPDTSSEGHRALWAGLLGMITSQALKSGVMRGLVSNEAGCGTAPMAHATVRTDSPAAQGMLGIVEVFVDTVLLCTLTALCMMVSDSGIAPYGADGVSNARAAFTSVLGSWAGGVFSVSILLFAAATVFCWAHYGLTALSGLTGILGHPEWNRVPKLVFTVAFCSSLVFGSVAAPDLAWNMADTAIGLMTVLNLTFLLLEHREIAWETQRFLSDQFRHGQSARGLDRPTATNRLSGQL
jgi:AGCS family alanine or glycine:cation symporter